MKRGHGEDDSDTDGPSAVFVGLPSGPVFDLFQAATGGRAALQVRDEDVGKFAGHPVSAAVVDGRRRGAEALLALIRTAADTFPSAKIIVFVDTLAEAEDLGDHAQLHAVYTPEVAPDRLAGAIEDTRRLHALQAAAGPSEPAGGRANDQMMLGASPAMQEVYRMVRCFAAADAPVLITGESGTGKELAARAIHERSAFAQGPFVAINCGGIPGELIASELFGYEKGAFTGARETKPGRIETAANGTLFLDEIGDLPLALQAHLLRFLQDGAIERVGGLKTIKVPTRIVAGTNVDLDRAIERGSFRADLFYRLNVLRLSLPPLRARQDDAVLIAHHLVRAMRRDHGKPKAELSPGAIAAIRAHTWPGNVRELISALRRGLTMCRRSRIAAEDLGIPRADAAEAPPTLEQARTQAEQEAITRALQHCGYRVRDAARALDISHVTLYSLLKKHNLSARYDSGSLPERQQV